MNSSITLYRALKKLYEDLDRVAEKRVREERISCIEGCSWCCYQIATVSIIEAIMIAEYLMNRKNWQEWLPKIRQAAIENTFEGVGPGTYFKKCLPCIFLKEGLCEIYRIRPSECRYLYVLSPAEDCRPPSVKGTLALDMSPLKDRIGELARVWREEHGRQGIDAGVLPIMLVDALKILTAESSHAKEAIREAFKDILSPQEWFKRHWRTFFEQTEIKRESKVKGS